MPVNSNDILRGMSPKRLDGFEEQKSEEPDTAVQKISKLIRRIERK